MAILSYKEKARIHDGGRNCDPIIPKLGTYRSRNIQIEFVDELCGAKLNVRKIINIFELMIFGISKFQKNF